MLHNRCTGICKFGNNTHPWRIRSRSNLGHIFRGGKKCVLWAGKYGIFQRAKLSTRSITHLCWCNWRTFWRKNAAEGHQGGLLLARQCPCSPGTCNTEETGLPGLPMSLSPTLFSESGSVELRPVPWTEKAIERSPFFVRRGGHCCRGDLVGRTNFSIFLLVAWKKK